MAIFSFEAFEFIFVQFFCLFQIVSDTHICFNRLDSKLEIKLQRRADF